MFPVSIVRHTEVDAEGRPGFLTFRREPVRLHADCIPAAGLSFRASELQSCSARPAHVMQTCGFRIYSTLIIVQMILEFPSRSIQT